MNPLRGIALKVASVCVFVAMASLVKATSDIVPPGQAVFFRSFFAGAGHRGVACDAP